MKKIFGIVGGLIVALMIASAAQAAVVTVSCSPSNVPANPIQNSSAANLASGAYVEVIDSTSPTAAAPSPTTGLPADTVNYKLAGSGNLSAAGTFTKSGLSIATGHYLYIIAWETWNGTGTPTGNYGISVISPSMAGVSYTYKPVTFQTIVPIAPVSLSSASPAGGYQGDIMPGVALVGVNTHFANGTSAASFGSNITVASTSVTSATQATANTVTINCAAATGARAVTVTTGAENASGNVFTVNAPSVAAPSPNSGTQGWTNVVVTINGTGTHFINGTTTVGFSGAGITLNSTTVNSATQVVVNLNIDSAAAVGARTVTISTNLGTRGTETLTTSFTVNAAATPTLVSISPTSGNQSQTLDVTLTGSNTTWSGTMTSSVIFSGSGITVNSATATSATSITANITIASGAATGARTVSVTGTSGTVGFSVNATGTPSLVSATPNSGAQGATIPSIAIVGSNTHFTAASTVSFGGTDITSGTITATDATHLTVSNVVISASAATGARTVTVTTAAEIASGQVFTVTGGITLPATTLVLDDIEGTLVLPSGYYAFAPTGQPNPTETRITTDKHEGNYAMNTTYASIADSTNAWRGWGGTFVSTKDVSAYDTLSIWVKGDGSTTNKLKVQFKDAAGNNFGMQDADAISQSSTGWAEYRVGGFKAKMTRVPGTTDHGAMDWTKVTEYQIVFSGTAASSAGVMVDYLNVTNSTSTGPHITSITPTSGGEKLSVTITGTNFQASGGTVNFAGGGTTTSVKTSDIGSLITSWTDSQVILSLPRMATGTKTVSLVRFDSTPSDNSITFEVTGITTGGGTSYNYPNPFNPLSGEKTNIIFDPGSAANVTVYIYDMTAKQMARINWAQGAPSAQVIWDGKNIYDEIVGDGVYLYRVVDAGSNKMIGKGKILVVNK